MPGNVLYAAPATVLPLSLCKSFVPERAYSLSENEYKNGESQRSVLTPSALQTRRDFFDARNGSTEPFYLPYSCRSASMGSTRVARCAGSQDAATATATNKSDTAARVVGSWGVTR